MLQIGWHSIGFTKVHFEHDQTALAVGAFPLFATFPLRPSFSPFTPFPFRFPLPAAVPFRGLGWTTELVEPDAGEPTARLESPPSSIGEVPSLVPPWLMPPCTFRCMPPLSPFKLSPALPPAPPPAPPPPALLLTESF
jgi:hypothetical protein